MPRTMLRWILSLFIVTIFFDHRILAISEEIDSFLKEYYEWRLAENPIIAYYYGYIDNVTKVSKGSFKNYVDIISVLFFHLPTSRLWQYGFSSLQERDTQLNRF